MAQTKAEWLEWYGKVYLKSQHWEEVTFRMKDFYWRMKWDWQCDVCQSKIKLQLHHNNYDCLYKEEIQDLDLLCDECHKEEHKNNNHKYYGKLENGTI